MTAHLFDRSSVAGFVLAALLVLMPAGGAAVEFLPIDVADPSWDVSQALDVNARGHVVGVYLQGALQNGFLYSGGTIKDICPPGWSTCLAISISENGTIGGAGNSGSALEGFIYSGGVYTPVTVPGASTTFVLSVNDNGDSAGYAVVTGVTWAFRQVGGALTTFLPLGYTSMRAQAINSSGDVVGAGVVGGGDKAFAFVGGAMSDPAPPGWTDTEARSINDSGDIIGDGESGGVVRCWLNRGGAFTVIIPPGWEDSTCTDINNSGVVIGHGDPGTGTSSPFVYHKGRYNTIDGVIQLIALSDSGHVAGLTTEDLVTFKAVAGLLLPGPDIQANGSDGPFILPPGKSLGLSASLALFSLFGRMSDWWIFAQTPAGPFTFDIASLRWVPGFHPAAVMPLRSVPKAKLPPAGTARGLYTYFLGVDLIPNGRVDVKYLLMDRVIVFVR